MRWRRYCSWHPVFAQRRYIGVAIDAITPAELAARMPALTALLDVRRLSDSVAGLRREKYDGFLPEALLGSPRAERHMALLPDLAALLRTIAGRNGGDP